jgi:hypothetical protein
VPIHRWQDQLNGQTKHWRPERETGLDAALVRGENNKATASAGPKHSGGQKAQRQLIAAGHLAVRTKGSNRTQRNEGSGKNFSTDGGSEPSARSKARKKTSAEKNHSLESMKNEAGNGGSSRTCVDKTEEWEEQTVGTKILKENQQRSQNCSWPKLK